MVIFYLQFEIGLGDFEDEMVDECDLEDEDDLEIFLGDSIIILILNSMVIFY